MRIAVTYGREDGQVFQHFGHCEYFKVYETEGGQVASSKVVSAAGSGHGALASFLQEQGVEALICGGIGAGAREALAGAGIRFYPGVSGDANASVKDFLDGKLAYDPETVCSHHHDDGHGGAHRCGEDPHGCGGNH